MSLFANSRNTLVHGGTFVAISHTGLSGIQYLLQTIATGAIHDSAERHDAPKCHQATRQRILGNIMDWIRNRGRSKDVLQLIGSAGAGKSAILQTIAELCEAEGILAGTFFFSRALEECNSGRKLFSTLAYQLAISIPQLQEHIESVLKSDPAIVKKSMDKQLKKLILSPMSELLRENPQPPVSPHVIIIDGLDECIDDKQQTDILRFLLEAVKDPNFPFCVIIASRPECNITNQFDSSGYRSVAWDIHLDNTSNRRDTKEDIRAYLRAEFTRIHDDPIHEMESVPRPWPSEYTIDKLVKRSSGQFVYATTVLKFVDDPDCAPSEQLRIIMNLLKGHPVAFMDLDQLYKDVLQKCPNRERTLDVLGYLIALTQAADAYSATWGAPLNTSHLLVVIDHFLGLKPGDSFRSLRRLQSLISITSPPHREPQGTGYPPGPECSIRKGSLDDQMASIASQKVTGSQGIKFHHASFSDFLRKEKRSGHYFIKISSIHTKITCSCLQVMSSFSETCISPNEYLVWVYAVIFWCFHCTKSQHDESLIKRLHEFNVCDDWIIVQSLASHRVNEKLLQEALKTFEIQELKDCPAQGRWFVGKPDLQSMSKDLSSVITWLKHPDIDNASLLDTVSSTASLYSHAFDTSFTRHLAQSPDRNATLMILGTLRSGEISERMLLDFQAIIDNGLGCFLEPLNSFIYRYNLPSYDSSSSSTSTDSLSSAEPSSDYRLGIRSESFVRFLERPRSSGKYLGSKIHCSIASTLLGTVSLAISKAWNPADYAQAWTFSLLRTKKYHEDLVERLLTATALYMSSSYLQRGLRRHHAKRVLAWLKRGPDPQRSDLITKWSSPPIWKDTWHIDKQRPLDSFPSPVLYELAIVHPLDSIRNDGF